MDTTSVILAVASPPGQAARGIVRASGARACAVLAANMADGCAGRAAVTGRVRGVHVVRLLQPAIPALCVVMPGPSSATGEDCAEIHAVGNPLVLERIVEAVISCSGGEARRAHPGEFSARAVLHGRIGIGGKGLWLSIPLSEITTTSPFSISRTKCAPIMSRAQVSDARM